MFTQCCLSLPFVYHLPLFTICLTRTKVRQKWTMYTKHGIYHSSVKQIWSLNIAQMNIAFSLSESKTRRGNLHSNTAKPNSLSHHFDNYLRCHHFNSIAHKEDLAPWLSAQWAKELRNNNLARVPVPISNLFKRTENCHRKFDTKYYANGPPEWLAFIIYCPEANEEYKKNTHISRAILVFLEQKEPMLKIIYSTLCPRACLCPEIRLFNDL